MPMVTNRTEALLMTLSLSVSLGLCLTATNALAAPPQPQPVYVEIAPRVDIRDQQLRALDRRAARVSSVVADAIGEGQPPEQIALELQVILPELAPSVVSLIPTLAPDEWQ